MTTLTSLDFVEAPDNFDQSSTLREVRIADISDGGQVIIGIDMDTNKAEFVYGRTAYAGPWYSTLYQSDFETLDRTFGSRKEWQEFLADYEETYA